MHAVISYSHDKQLLEDRYHLGCEVEFQSIFLSYFFMTQAKKLRPKDFMWCQ